MSIKGLLIEQAHMEVGIAAVADVFAGDVASDVFSMRKHNRILWIAHWGVGATGVVAFTVEACDDVVPTNTTKVPFWYRTMTAGAAPGAVTAAVAATGVSNTAGSNQVILIETTAMQVKAAGGLGYDFVRLFCDETTDSPLLGGVLALLLEPTFAENETSMVA